MPSVRGESFLLHSQIEVLPSLRQSRDATLAAGAMGQKVDRTSWNEKVLASFDPYVPRLA